MLGRRVEDLRFRGPWPVGVQVDGGGAPVDRDGLEGVDLVDDDEVTGPQDEFTDGDGADGAAVDLDAHSHGALDEVVMVGDDHRGIGGLIGGRELPAGGNPGAGQDLAAAAQTQAVLLPGTIDPGGVEPVTLGAPVREVVDVTAPSLAPLPGAVGILLDKGRVLEGPLVP